MKCCTDVKLSEPVTVTEPDGDAEPVTVTEPDDDAEGMQLDLRAGLGFTSQGLLYMPGTCVP